MNFHNQFYILFIHNQRKKNSYAFGKKEKKTGIQISISFHPYNVPFRT
jgi:hypothetical protein